jgi:hypothetical protein
MANKLDVVNAYFIGFRIGKWHGNDIETLLLEMNLTKKEWIDLKKDYPIESDIDEKQFNEIEKYFNLL